MVEKKDLHRLHLTLDSSSINRCVWCGTQQSDVWIPSAEGMYCSASCMKAGRLRTRRLMSFMLVLLLASFVLMQLANSSYFGSDLRAQVVIFGVALVLLFTMIYISLIQYRKLAKDVPKGSRSDIGPTEVSLLRRISAPVECHNCDAKIDLTNVGEDMIYTCPYCGANGIVEIEILT